MIGIILISENNEAHEMLKTVRRLLGRKKGMTSIILNPAKPVPRLKEQLRKAIRQVDSHEGVILMTDFFGSTQCNVCMNFVKRGNVELVTGFNLPMLLKLARIREAFPLSKLVPFITRYGREHIRHVR